MVLLQFLLYLYIIFFLVILLIGVFCFKSR